MLGGEWSPCWLWLGSINREEGYGKITLRVEGRGPIPILAHRLSYEAHHGVKLAKSEQLRHLCHRPRCIHPNHTLPGSAFENYLDQVDRGTHINQRASFVLSEEDLRSEEEALAEREPGSDG